MPDAAPDTAVDPTPSVVTRVYELYEQLGREDVEAVQKWEKSQAGHDTDTAAPKTK